MRRRPAFLAALLVLCTLAVAHLPGNAGEDSPAKELKVIVYPVSDLPVWKYSESIKWATDENGHSRPTQNRPDGGTKFDATLLITVIKSSVDPETWEEVGSIRPHEKAAALVIRSTQANHEMIASLLQRLRTKPANEKHENLSLINEFRTQKMRALNAVFLSERLRSTDRVLAVSTLKEAIERLDKSSLDEDQKGTLQERLQRQLDHVQSTAAASHRSGSTPMKMHNSAGAILRSPLLQQVEALPYEQSVQVPMDVEVLVDRLARPTVPHAWPTYKEWDVPVDRDFYFGGYRLTR